MTQKYKGRGTVQVTGRNAGKSYWTNKAIERLIRDLNSNPVEALMLSEGTVYGTRYYCVEPIGGSWIDMETWCLDTFGVCEESIWGSDIPEPACRWYVNNRKFWFREQKDRDWFVIKWNS